MRKRLIAATPKNIQTHGEGRLDVERMATVEMTSEDTDFPIEAALISGNTRGWRAATPESQTIRLIFDQPQRLSRVSLVFRAERIRAAPKNSCCAGRGVPAELLQGSQANGQHFGVGLSGMRERVNDLGGTFEIQSNGGTLITVSIPLAK